MQPHLDSVSLAAGQVLQDPCIPARYAYFIEYGAASLQAWTKMDNPVEVGLAGCMGMVGVPVILGTMRSPLRAVVQMPGEALRISAGHLRSAMSHSPVFRRILMNYIQAEMVQTSLLVLCNARHTLDERIARWILIARDRVDSDEIPVTHDLLSRILGVRRASVTEAVGRLERRSIIHANRGLITIKDCRQLEDASCDCCRIIRAEYSRIVDVGGSSARPSS